MSPRHSAYIPPSVKSLYCIIQVFNHSFLKSNIETKDGCKFDKILRNGLWEFQQGCKYMHQILIVINNLKIRLLIKEDLGWYGRANFAGKLFYSVHLIPL